MLLKTKSLTPYALSVVRDKGTDLPNTGSFDALDEPGTYLCRQCGWALFRSEAKFSAHCGWPSFDEMIPGRVLTEPDTDGRRTEIICARCQAHLGHVFYGEGYTKKDTRHCVNSTSLDFTTSKTVLDTEEGIFAGGCFWGVEHLFKELPGVVLTEVGYTGGHKTEPTYEDVCTGLTGHYEAIRVVYDVLLLDFRMVAQYFFEIHDPTQEDGQGPDIGLQYESVAFYYDDRQMNELKNLFNTLTNNGHQIKTTIKPVSIFWPAEEYHQNYYAKTGNDPYCHHYTKRFG